MAEGIAEVVEEEVAEEDDEERRIEADAILSRVSLLSVISVFGLRVYQDLPRDLELLTV